MRSTLERAGRGRRAAAPAGCWPARPCRRAARRSRSSRRAARQPSSPAPSRGSASTRSAACSSRRGSTAWPRSPSPSCSPPPSIPDGWVVGTGNAGKVLKIDRKGERQRAVRRSRARGLRRLGRSGRHGLRRHLAAGQGLPHPSPGEGCQGGGLLRSRRDLHLGAGPRRRRLAAGRHRHRGEALPRRRQGQGHGPLRQRRHPHPDARAAPRRRRPGRHRRRGADPARQPRRPRAHPLRRPGARGRLAGGGAGRHLLRRGDRLRGEPGRSGAGPGGAARAAGRRPGGRRRRPGRAAAQPQVSVTVEPVDTPTVAAGGAQGRPAPAAPRSEVLSISPSGVVESLWTFAEDTIYGLLWQNGKLWVATGLEGKLYRWADQQMLLEKDVDERQIVAVLPGDPGPVFATTNAAALFRVVRGSETTRHLHQRGARRRAAGALRHLLLAGGAPRRRGGPLLLPQRRQRRAGPHLVGLDRAARGQGDPARRPPQGALRAVAGRAAGGVPGTPGGSPRIYETELSYRQENLRPKIGTFQALDPGQILVPANFNPTNQVYEPAHPNREGIFNSLAARRRGRGLGRAQQGALEARLPDPALDGGRPQRRRSGLRSLLPSGARRDGRPARGTGSRW